MKRTINLNGRMNRITVVMAGLRDGWEQPYDLSSSTSVPEEYQELLGMSLSMGQVIRAGSRSQPYREGFWPFRNPHQKEQENTHV